MKVQTVLKSVCLLLSMLLANSAFAQYPEAGQYKLQNVFTGMYAKNSGQSAILLPYAYDDAPEFTIDYAESDGQGENPILSKLECGNVDLVFNLHSAFFSGYSSELLATGTGYGTTCIYLLVTPGSVSGTAHNGVILSSLERFLTHPRFTFDTPGSGWVLRLTVQR